MDTTVRNSVAPQPLIVLAVICGLAVTAIHAARIFDVGTTHLVYQTAETSRSLRFEDAANGSVLVKDASNGAQLDEIAPGNNGFVRIVLRTLARDRLNAGIGSLQPFTLTRWSDGRVSITDPATGRHMELRGFGANNVAAFAKYLPQGGQS